MIGDYYWSTGIKVRYVEPYEGKPARWSASADFYDAGFCQDPSTEGHFHTRYAQESLSAAIDVLKADMERMGIVWADWVPTTPSLYVEGDGKRDDVPLPTNWRELVNAEAERIGWHASYAREEER